MGKERRMFHELEGPLESLTARQLQSPLEEIASGTASFGPLAEWHNWYHYLLGALIPRCHETLVSPLLEVLITAFMALYPNGLGRPPYPEFAADVLSTLGRCLMVPQCWKGGEIAVGEFLHRSNRNPAQVWGWWYASGDFSASLYFCLKYLPPALVRGWFTSLLEIESPHWRAQVLAWLVGSDGLLRGRLLWPSEFERGAQPDVRWDWSHCLKRELADEDESGLPAATSFITEESRVHVLAASDDYFSSDKFVEWLESIARVPYLESELGNIPVLFKNIYLRQPG